MEKIITKPSFRETVAVKTKTMDLDDVGFSFNAQRVGPTNFYGLRKADYGEGFRIPIMPEIVPLVYASLENQKYETAKNVINTLGSGLVGNTAVHYFPEGMFVEDIPKMKNKRIITPTQKELENRLGSHKEKEVVFSDDRSVRFTPHNFRTGSQQPFRLCTNTGIIALVGGEENAEKLAIGASENHKFTPHFYALDHGIDSPQTRVVALFLYDSDDRLVIDADIFENYGHRFSFGVQKIKQEEKTQ